MTVDEQRGIVYMTFGAPTSTYYGGDRQGDNLYANSVVAIDAETGKYKWHFQAIHHDIWDYDLPPAPGLIDIVQNGRRIPALAQTGKMGLMFILEPRHRQTCFRRRGTTCSQIGRPDRTDLPDTALSAQTATIGAHHF